MEFEVAAMMAWARKVPGEWSVPDGAVPVNGLPAQKLS
jgi:hypothetical protein